MAIQLNLKPVTKAISNEFTGLKTTLSSFFNQENLNLVANRLVETGLNQLQNYVESQITHVFSELVTKFDNDIRKIVSRLNSVITFPNIFDVLGVGLGPTKLPENPFIDFDPNITGIFFVFIMFPDKLVRESPTNLSNLCGFLAKSVTDINQTITTSTRKGIGNTQLTIPKTMEYDRTITVTFYDTYELSIYQIFKTWMNLVIDQRSGFHNYRNFQEIKGTITVVHYTPSMKKQIQVNSYLGVFPTSIPALEEDRSNVTIREIPITFAFDTI